MYVTYRRNRDSATTVTADVGFQNVFSKRACYVVKSDRSAAVRRESTASPSVQASRVARGRHVNNFIIIILLLLL